ncbi:hypothetical protein Dthio_PD3747 [Desulfonatronospira thiodismutans ASO3-1]|uniref:Ferritin/DPS domain-containing protein n=1 Tax=Desulfonatronospira thiodismutans ASO3-1 TaxID=555779 RepID=D6SK81_9BACT|nr:ferritin-like domain-containing protein [Desulfonatronospira thiodismutans]EFI36284.1 hypothetical protein Dthio_PD3747 [Desulfonatronospira thiodismutans ASO3-1]
MSQKADRHKNLPHPMRITNQVLSRRSLLRTGAGALGIFLAAPGLTWASPGDTRQSEEAIELMILALQHEHGAFVQYANHAALLSMWLEEDLTRTYETIIADEVSHAISLVTALKKSGAEPTLAVWPARSGDDPGTLLRQDIAAEENAVEIYRRIIDLDISSGLRTELEKILKAEKAHQEVFEELLSRAG